MRRKLRPAAGPVTLFHYVCFDCAEVAQKGHRPKGTYGFTVHVGICDQCKKRRPLGHVRDFGLDEHLVFRNLSPLD